MSYEVLFARRADKALDKLPQRVQDRVEAAVDLLAEDPRPPQRSRKMQGQRAEGVGEDRRLRVGDYRVVYKVEEPHPEYPEPDDGELAGLVTVLAVGHRQGIYG